MAIQYSVTLRNNQLGQIETTIGTAPKLRISTGSKPANCAAADSGTLLVEITLPSDWLGTPGTPDAGVVYKAGTWSGTATADGTAGHWRIKDSTGTTVHTQGTITATGGGGDITLDNTSITTSQTVTITSASFTAGNA
jgi:hypothetical protein